MSSYNKDKIREVAGELAAAFVKNYKCSLEEAGSFFLGSILKHDEVARLVDAAVNPKQLSRNAIFKNFVKKSRKELYYQLRKYKNNADDRAALQSALEAARAHPTEEALELLLQSVADFHVSSEERFEENDVFYDQLHQVLANAATIVDIGCGVQPLFFPAERFANITRYVALDKDKESVQLMQDIKAIFPHKYQWLHPDNWNISEGCGKICKQHGIETFDVALVLKVVAVVQRTHPELVEELKNLAAKTLVVSGVKESMVKKQDIGRRERRLLLNFIESCGRTKLAEFELKNEFVIIA